MEKQISEMAELRAENRMLRQGAMAVANEMIFMETKQIPAIKEVYEARIAKLEEELKLVKARLVETERIRTGPKD